MRKNIEKAIVRGLIAVVIMSLVDARRRQK
jgi:hypothetical protein